jgi:twitching motility protein PilT
MCLPRAITWKGRRVASLKVLIVNEDVSEYERLAAVLRSSGPDIAVMSAISAENAVEVASAQHPDVVIADAELSGTDGYSLAAQLRSQPGLSSIPTILLSPDPNEMNALKARRAGAAAHLPRTVEPAVLLEKVRALTNAPVAVGAESRAVAFGAARSPDAPSPAGLTREDPVPADSASVAPATGAVPQAPERHVAGSAPHVDDLLRLMIDMNGSDLHLTVGSPPGIRLRGEIIPCEEYKPLSPKDTQEMLLSMLSEEQRRRFETELELDFAYSIPGLSRFRANIFQQRNSMGAVFRVIPLKIPTMEELNLPKVCKYLADRPRGLVLVTGPTGSGKSTTLAAMIDHINETRPVHIITLEDPIEFMHRNKKAYVNQREIGEDTHSFAAALKRVLRQDPDVILVGEMRDLETISAAITAAETGHLVLATLHTTGGPETVDRIIDVFPPHQQQQVRMQLSATLEGVLSQVLLRASDGKHRVLAMEIMLGVPAISNLIREGKTHQMPTIIQAGQATGMQTLDQHLKVLLQSGKVTFEEAISKAKEPRELAAMVGRRI